MPSWQRAACMVSVLQHKLPSTVLNSASTIVIFPELLSTVRRGTGGVPDSVSSSQTEGLRRHVSYTWTALGSTLFGYPADWY
jgi:hypothetical protein